MIDNMAKDFAIRIRNTAPVVRTRAGASGIELTLRFLAHPRRRRRLMDRVNRRIMEAVDRADNIDFAYNTIHVMPTSPVIDPQYTYPDNHRGSNIYRSELQRHKIHLT